MSHSPDLRQKVEDLALRLVVADPEAGGAGTAGSWLPELRLIHEAAKAENEEQASSVTGALLAAIEKRRGEKPDAALWTEMQEGIARLQQVLDTDSAGPRKAERMPAEDPELLTDFVLESRETRRVNRAAGLDSRAQPIGRGGAECGIPRVSHDQGTGRISGTARSAGTLA